MVEFLNQLSAKWSGLMVTWTLQNSLFLLVIFALLTIFRKRDILFLKYLTLIGLIKLFIPPLFVFKAPEPVVFVISESYPVISVVSQNIQQSARLSSGALLMGIWMLLSLSIFLFTLYRYFRLKGVLRDAQLIDMSDFAENSASLHTRFFKSTTATSPFVLGFFRQCIVLPYNWDTWSHHQKIMVVTHELSHIRQNDHWINLLKVIAFVLNFFNPLVWILIIKHNKYTELVCDELTIQTTGLSGSDYSRELVSLSEHMRRIPAFIPTTLAFSESYKILKNRISYHLSDKEGYQMKFKKHHLKVYVLLCALLMIPFLWKCESDQPVKSETEISDKIYNWSEVSTRPVPIEHPQPVYPQKAIDNQVEGFVQIEVIINEYGEVTDASVNEKVSIPLLNDAALETAKKYKFSPALLNGVPVKVRMPIPFNFDLDFANPAAAKSRNLYQFYNVSVKPLIIKKEIPVYPNDARENGIEGKVVLNIIIDEQGDVEEAKVFMSQHPELNEAALQAVKKCKFAPAQVDGKPVKVKMNVPFDFKLEKSVSDAKSKSSRLSRYPGAYEVKELDEPLKMIHVSNPFGSERKGIGLDVLVDEQGNVEKAIVIEAGSTSELNEKAMEAIKEFKFSPPTKDGKPVKASIPILF